MQNYKLIPHDVAHAVDSLQCSEGEHRDSAPKSAQPTIIDCLVSLRRKEYIVSDGMKLFLEFGFLALLPSSYDSHSQ